MPMNAADRMRRYRARQRGENVPKLQPGPKPMIEIVRAKPDEPASAVQSFDWLKFGDLVAKFQINRGWLDARGAKIRWRGFPASAEYNVADVERELVANPLAPVKK